jgi:MoxR-like ATPase
VRSDPAEPEDLFGAQPVPILSSGATHLLPSAGVSYHANEGYPPSSPGPFADGPFSVGTQVAPDAAIKPVAAINPGGPFAPVDSYVAGTIPMNGTAADQPAEHRGAAQDGSTQTATPETGASQNGHVGSEARRDPDQPPPPTGRPISTDPPRPPQQPVVTSEAQRVTAVETHGAPQAPKGVSLPPPPPSRSGVKMPPAANPAVAEVVPPQQVVAEVVPPPQAEVPRQATYEPAAIPVPEPPRHQLTEVAPEDLVVPPQTAQPPQTDQPLQAAQRASTPATTHRVLAAQAEQEVEPLGLDGAIELGQALVANLRHVVLGTPGALTAVAVAALSGGHLLIEDVPGVGKTVLAQALAASLGTELSRLQGHPDLLPSDVTGVSVFSPETGSWEFKPGPVFAHVVLVDELNRTPPRTQAALLETMEEQQVSADGESWALPVPHMVIATQNPHSQLGTYPLVESQLDRFALATAVGYPEADVETQIVMQHGGRPALPDLRPVCNPFQWYSAQLATQSVVVDEAVAGYAVALCRGSRGIVGVKLGASPRAAIWLVRTAQAHAVLSGRGFVTPGDVKAMALACLSHRLTTDEGVAFGVKVVKSLLDSTPAPRP